MGVQFGFVNGCCDEDGSSFSLSATIHYVGNAIFISFGTSSLTSKIIHFHFKKLLFIQSHVAWSLVIFIFA